MEGSDRVGWSPEGRTAWQSPELSPRQFFENSRRRDANASERALVAYVNGCAAFFVENSRGKVFLASARHCFSSAITRWCQGGGQFRDNDGKVGVCTRVVAAATDLDIAVFEASFAHAPATQLRLAAYAPPVRTRLFMIGYPADADPTTARRGRLTVTENCWVLSSDTPSPYQDLRDRSAHHNCSTYGGNSGGPMIAEGTLSAVGLPFTYVPNDYRRREAESLATAAHLAKMQDFVGRFRTTLDAEGIGIDDEPVPGAALEPRSETESETEPGAP
jgi:hypothetical protein